VRIGRSDLPDAIYAGGSLGTSSWGWAVVKACQRLVRELGGRAEPVPPEGLEVMANTAADVGSLRQLARAAYGAHFVRVKVDVVHHATGIRVRDLPITIEKLARR